MAKLYGPARAVDDIGSLQIETSSYPVISAVNKATFISKINATDAVRDKIVAGEDLTDAEFVIAENANNTWNGSISIIFGSITVKSVVTSVSLSDAVAFLESWGGVVITPVSRSVSSVVTLTNVTYGTATKQVEKLYGSANALGNPPLKGNTTQQTYTGKNKLGFPNGSGTFGSGTFSWSVQDGVITLDGGTGTGSSTLRVLNTTLFKLSAETRRLTIIPISGTWTKGTMGIRPKTADDAQRGYQQWNTGSPQTNATYTYTETQASESVSVDLYIGADAIFDNYKFYIMWTAGSTDDFDYEPYVGGTPSPNPDYPQAVRVATGEQRIRLNGKNLSPIITGYNVGTNGGASYTKSNGTIIINTGSTGTSTNKGIYINKSTNEDYCPEAYMTGYIVSFTVVASAESYFAYRNEGQAYNYATIGTTPMRLSFPSGTRNMIFYAKEQNITFTLSDFQVETGTTATAFSPYAQLYTVSLGSIELCKIDTYQDYIHKSGDDWYIKKYIGKGIYDGDEDITVHGTKNSIVGFRLPVENGVLPGTSLFCNYCVSVPFNTYYSDNRTYGMIATHNSQVIQNVYISAPDSSVTTLQTLSTWLSSHNTSVYYVLATPTETKITNSTLISQLNALWSATTYGDDTVLTIGAVDLQAIGTDIFRSTRRIEKFYGSVNNKTKLIYEE